ncbi:hypothetical protein PUN28_005568 [Cardiocondyla obscurior]|uniref:Uncharacterized protein n=1 Tax=Cardiocondyla obscurior TaxID=286306 RepID=A0AAW2GMF7_9HYME
MRSTKEYVSSMKFKNIKDTNVAEKEIISSEIAAETELRNALLIRKPNILRGNAIKTTKNHTLNKTDNFVVYSVEEQNMYSELNTSSSSEIDIEASSPGNKTTLPKLHHQRKQVHNPLDIQYDISYCNNNKNDVLPKNNTLNTSHVDENKNLLPKDDESDTLLINKSKKILPKIDQLINVLHVSLKRKKKAPKKNTKCNNKEKNSLNKNSKKVIARKSNKRKQTSRKKPETSATISNANSNDTNMAVQNATAFLDNILDDAFTKPVCDLNYPNTNENDFYGTVDRTTKLVESTNIFYPNNEGYNVGKKYDINLNHNLVSYKPTEFAATQYRTIQREFTSSEFLITENDWQQEAMNRNIDSNFLYKSKVLHPCTCANCMSHDKDIIFYEDPVSTSTSSYNMETELLTYDLYANIDDFNNYFNIFDNLMDSEETNFYCEDFEKENLTKENTCIDATSTTKLIENSTNISSDQNKLQNLSCHIIPADVRSYSTEYVTYPYGTIRMEDVNFNNTDVSNYLNVENFLTKESEIISQDNLMQPSTSTDVPVSNFNCETSQNNIDLCLIPCFQCGKLFRKKHQFWKHFTSCDFYKENFKCHICNKMYRHKSSLAKHLQLRHQVTRDSDEKCYTCNKCSKSYIRFRAFQRHMLLHND